MVQGIIHWNRQECFRFACYLGLAYRRARFIDDAHAGLFHRHVQSSIMFHGCPSPLMLEAAHADLVQSST